MCNRTIRISRCFALILGLACWLPLSAGDSDDAAVLAERFARQFIDGRHESNVVLMTEQMNAAAGPKKWEELRASLVAQHGETKKPGDAWSEDTVQGYRRFRVPLGFEKMTLDLRIVVDTEGKIAGVFIVPHVAPPSERPEVEAPGREIDLSIGEGESALPATLTLPRGDGPFAGVVLVHGSGPNDRDETVGPNKPFRDIAWGMAQRGVATLRYDKRSFSRPDDLASVGAGLTVREEVIEDARLALKRLAEREEIDGSRVFVAGHSLGGTLAPRIAKTDLPPAGIIVLAGMTLPLPEKMVTQTRYIVSLDGDVSDEEQAHLDRIEAAVGTLRAALDGKAPDPEGPILGAPIGYFRDLESHDPPREAAALGLPVLVIQGSRDYQVTMEDFKGWKAALGASPRACLAVYERLDHLLREGEGPSGPHDYERAAPVDSGVLNDMAAWIRDRSCPS